MIKILIKFFLILNMCFLKSVNVSEVVNQHNQICEKYSELSCFHVAHILQVPKKIEETHEYIEQMEQNAKTQDLKNKYSTIKSLSESFNFKIILFLNKKFNFILFLFVFILLTITSVLTVGYLQKENAVLKKTYDDCFVQKVKYNATCDSVQANCALEISNGEPECIGYDKKNETSMQIFCTIYYNKNGTFYNPKTGTPDFCIFSHTKTKSFTILDTETVSDLISISNINTATQSVLNSDSIPISSSKTILNSDSILITSSKTKLNSATKTDTITKLLTFSDSSVVSTSNIVSVSNDISTSMQMTKTHTKVSVLECIKNPCIYADEFNFGDNKAIKCNDAAHRNYGKFCGSVCTNCTFAFFKKYGINDTTSAINFMNKLDFIIRDANWLGSVIGINSNNNGEKDLEACPTYCFFQGIGNNEVEYKVDYEAIASYDKVKSVTDNFSLLLNNTRSKAAMTYIAYNIYNLRFLNNTFSVIYFNGYNYLKSNVSGYEYLHIEYDYQKAIASLKLSYLPDMQSSYNPGRDALYYLYP